MISLPQRSRMARGMVLLEVILALTIFTTVAFALVMALDAANDAAIDRNRIDQVTVGLQNQMAQATLGQLAETRRDLKSDGTDIAYHLEVEPQTLHDDTKSNLTGFFRVTIQASWKERGQLETRELSQLVYQP